MAGEDVLFYLDMVQQRNPPSGRTLWLFGGNVKVSHAVTKRRLAGVNNDIRIRQFNHTRALQLLVIMRSPSIINIRHPIFMQFFAIVTARC